MREESYELHRELIINVRFLVSSNWADFCLLVSSISWNFATPSFILEFYHTQLYLRILPHSVIFWKFTTLSYILEFCHIQLYLRILPHSAISWNSTTFSYILEFEHTQIYLGILRHSALSSNFAPPWGKVHLGVCLE